MNIDKSLIDSDYVAVMLAFFVILYAFTLSRITVLPDYIKNIFNNNIFKILFLSLALIYGFEKTPTVAIVVAMIFVITVDKLGTQEMYENVAYFEAYIDQQNKEKNNN
jgi:hypothetical protein